MSTKKQKSKIRQQPTTRPAKLVNSLSNPVVSTSSSLQTLFSPSSAYLAHLAPSPSLATPHLLRVYDAKTDKVLARWAPDEGGDLAGKAVRVETMEWVCVPVHKAASGGQEQGRGKKRKKSTDGDAPATEAQASKADKEDSTLLAIGTSEGKIEMLDPLSGRVRYTLSSSSAIVALSFVADPSPTLFALDARSHLHVYDLASLPSKASAAPVHPRTTIDLATVSGLTAGPAAPFLALAVRRAAALSAAKEGKVNGVNGMEVDEDDDDSSEDESEEGSVAPTKKHKKKTWNGVNGAMLTSTDQAAGTAYDILLGSTTISLLRLSLSSSNPAATAEYITTLQGHVTPIQSLSFLPPSSSTASSSEITFLSTASSDRHLQLWSIDTLSRSGALRADFTAPADVTRSSVTEGGEWVAYVDGEGEAGLVSLGAGAGAGTKEGKKRKVRTLERVVKLAGREGSAGAEVVDLALVGGDAQKIRVVRGGVKVVFEEITIRDPSGALIPLIELSPRPDLSRGLLASTAEDSISGSINPTRPASSSTARIHHPIPLPSSSSDLIGGSADAEVDVDVDTEGGPTLAEQLRGLRVQKKRALPSGTSTGAGLESEDDDGDGESGFTSDLGDEDDADEDEEDGQEVAPSATLTQTLVQALHSNDSRLLEACLSHADPTLIRATLLRLQPRLVLRLVEALVERLSRAKAGYGQGAAGPGTQRARALVEWVRGCLVVHVGFLITVPSLVERLSHLHATLTARLATRSKLQALSGRLELIMSQIDAQRAQQARVGAGAGAGQEKGSRREAKVYREDELEALEGEEEEDEDGDVEIEDVVLGGAVRTDDESDSGEDELGSEEEDSEESGSEEDEEEEEEPPVGPRRRVAPALSPASSMSKKGKGKADRKGKGKANGLLAMDVDDDSSEEEGDEDGSDESEGMGGFIDDEAELSGEASDDEDDDEEEDEEGEDEDESEEDE